MRSTKQLTAATISAVIPMIETTVKLEQDAEALLALARANRATIKTALQAAQLARQGTPAGYEALLIEKEQLSWDPDKLARLLDPSEFDQLCPRKANGEQLRAWLEGAAGTPAEKKIRACAKAHKRVDLELRPPAAAPALAVDPSNPSYRSDAVSPLAVAKPGAA